MQTTNDKRKYKLQQLFKMLSLSFDTGLESFNGPINDGLFAVSRDLNESLLQFSQVAYWLAVYELLHAMMQPTHSLSLCLSVCDTCMM